MANYLLNQTQQDYYNGSDHGNYQFTSLNNIINQFIVAYVGEDKIISKAKRVDVAFHAQRALAELSFDTFKSCKAQEITVPASLQMILPQDYVNYTKISWVDSSGIKHPLYPTNKTSNPSSNPLQDSDGDFKLQAVGTLVGASSDIVLDAEYKDILVGMTVSGPYIPLGTIVSATSNSSSITTISMKDAVGNAVFPTDGTGVISNTGTTLTFESSIDGSLLLPQKSSHIVENLSWNLTDYKITGTASELEDIEIGMIVSHDDFPVGTTVTNVYTTTIVLDKLPVFGSAAVPSGGEITFISPNADTDTWSNYKSATPPENQDDYQDDTYWKMNGNRYGLDPQHAQANGSFYIDCQSGKVHFSSNISGKTVILDYISDSLGTDGEMQVHKFAEEAMYKWILHGILSTRVNVQEYVVRRFKKERFAAIRTAKLRLSNIKLEEITQILRGKSKQIKH
ncbi:hypothetical protein N9C94_00625 [Candidatus Pelagibacter sp.]|nr:hypothetical protein [Candidatus Pelagibacter sp.]